MKTCKTTVETRAGAGGPRARAGPLGDMAKPKSGRMRETEKTLSIALVEDEPNVSRASTRLLNSSAGKLGIDHEIEEVKSAKQLPPFIEDGVTFDLILLDLDDGTVNRFQGKMAGVKFIEWLIKQGRTEVLDKIVVLSGSLDALTEEHRAAIGHRMLCKCNVKGDAFEGLLRHVSEGRLGEWMPPVENS